MNHTYPDHGASSRAACRQIVEPFGSPQWGLSHMQMSLEHVMLARLLLSVEGVTDHPRG